MLLGAFFSVISSAAFGINTVFTRRGVLVASAANGIYVSVPLGVPLLAIAALVTGQLLGLGAISLTGYLFLAAAGVLHFILGRYSNYRATGAIGANRSNPLRAIATPFSIVAALLVLGERISWFNGLGIVTVTLAPTIMVERAEPRRDTDAPHPVAGPSNGASNPAAESSPATAVSDPARRGFMPTRAQLVEGYIFGALSAVGYGISPLFIRAAIGGTGLGIAGAFISYAAATLVLMVGLVQPGRLSNVRNMDRAAFRWFLLTAISGPGAGDRGDPPTAVGDRLRAPLRLHVQPPYGELHAPGPHRHRPVRPGLRGRGLALLTGSREIIEAESSGVVVSPA